MNKWKHAYPKEVVTLLATSQTMATTLHAALQSDQKSRLLGDLYELDEAGKCRRVKTQFLPDWQPNDKEVGKSEPSEKDELRGLYVFAEEVDGIWQPVYVGISRTVYRRLRQHGWYENPSSCTFAYLRCKDRLTSVQKAELRKSSKKRDPDLYKKTNDVVEVERSWLRRCRVALYPVRNHFDLYFHEVAVAGILKTEWNSFRTH